MRVTTLAKAEESFLPDTEAMKKILRFLRGHDFHRMKDGTYPIDGDRIYAMLQRYTTKPVRECKVEKHRKYYDVVYVFDGIEDIGWCSVCPDVELETPYDSEQDVEFYRALVPESYVVMKPESLAVISTTDIHAPCVAHSGKQSPVGKIVIKAEAALME